MQRAVQCACHATQCACYVYVLCDDDGDGDGEDDNDGDGDGDDDGDGERDGDDGCDDDDADGAAGTRAATHPRRDPPATHPGTVNPFGPLTLINRTTRTNDRRSHLKQPWHLRLLGVAYAASASLARTSGISGHGRGALSLQNEDPTPQDGWEKTSGASPAFSVRAPVFSDAARLGKRRGRRTELSRGDRE